MKLNRFAIACGLVGLLVGGGVPQAWAEPLEPSTSTTLPAEETWVPIVDREFADPEQLAPPRNVRPEETPSEPMEPLSIDLNTAMTEVLMKSPSLESVRARIRAAEYRIEEAYTRVNPRIDLTGQYSRVEPPVSLPDAGIVISPANNYQASLVLRQALLTFGRLKWNSLAAKFSRRSVQEEYRSELNRLVLLTAQRYIEALLALEAVSIAEDNLELQQANLRTSELLFEQGVSAQFDVFRNSAAASQARQELIEARTAASLARFRLMSLLDQPLDRELQLAPLKLLAPGTIELADAKERALTSRPELRSVRWAVEEAKAQVEAIYAERNPYLELQNRTVHQNVTGFSPGTQNTTLLVLNIPIYDGGLVRTQALQAQEAVQQIASELEQVERDVVLQVEETYYQLRDRWQGIQVAEENVVQAEEALRVAVLRYENGISTNVELLDAQAARSQAHFSLARAKADYLAARWTWWQATASEYPTEVPFPEEIRVALESEGLPLQPSDGPEFVPSDHQESLGVDRHPELPELEIRGLPRPDADQPEDPQSPLEVDDGEPTADEELEPPGGRPTQP